jgi:hypothetical protein
MRSASGKLKCRNTMGMKTRAAACLWIAVASGALLACGGNSLFGGSKKDCGSACGVAQPPGSGELQPVTEFGGSIHRLSGDEELGRYMDGVAARAHAAAKEAKASGQAASTESVEDSASPAEGAASNANVTNNQEGAAVDEGGIVKNIDDALIVLRRGRLSVVRTSPQLARTAQIDVAARPELGQGVWYDELLVQENRLVVIGYRYSPVTTTNGRVFTGSTEINAFIYRNGLLERDETVFLESYDYFSGSNYTARSIGSVVVLQSPTAALRWQSADEMPKLQIPHKARLSKEGGIVDEGPLFNGRDVFVPLEVSGYPTFQTFVKCDWKSVSLERDFSCSTTSILSPWRQEHYVSQDRFYMVAGKYIYAYDLKSDTLAAHGFDGRVTDQFSFAERKGVLHVVVTRPQARSQEDANPDGGVIMSDYGTLNRIDLLSLPVASFNGRGDQNLDSVRRQLLEGSMYIRKIRFFEDSLALAVEQVGWRKSNPPQIFTESSLHLIGFGDGNMSGSMELARYQNNEQIVRLERGNGNTFLAFVQSFGSDMNLSLASFSSSYGCFTPGKLGEVTLNNSTQGEWRSHGFFMKGDRFGIATRSATDPQRWWRANSGITFGSLDARGQFGAISSLAASQLDEDQAKAQDCTVSCIDWYGNTRPIFLGDKVYALMGSRVAQVKGDGSGFENIVDL